MLHRSETQYTTALQQNCSSKPLTREINSIMCLLQRGGKLTGFVQESMTVVPVPPHSTLAQKYLNLLGLVPFQQKYSSLFFSI